MSAHTPDYAALRCAAESFAPKEAVSEDRVIKDSRREEMVRRFPRFREAGHAGDWERAHMLRALDAQIAFVIRTGASVRVAADHGVPAEDYLEALRAVYRELRELRAEVWALQSNAKREGSR